MSLPKDALTDAEKAKLKETFSKIDTNNDGFLGKDEIINVFAKTGRKLTSVQVQVSILLAYFCGKFLSTISISKRLLYWRDICTYN